jgi:hypothetical protein
MIPASELKEFKLLYKTGSAPIVQVECLKSQWKVIYKQVSSYSVIHTFQ